MPKYVIERGLPGAGALTGDELQAISQKSVEVLDGMAGRAQWLESFVTGDKLYCVYIADDEATVREHATCGGFPCDSVSRVATYAYVNPVVAIVLGAVLLQEKIDLVMIVGAAIILVSVGVVLRAEVRANRAARELLAGAAEANPAPS